MTALPSRDASTVQIRERTAAVVADLEDTDDYAVYTLRCDMPQSEEELLDKLSEYYPSQAEDHYYDGPSWAQRAQFADELYYVGQTNELRNRLEEHVRGRSKAARFTTLFPPRELVSVEWVPDLETAKKREMNRKRELDDLEVGRQLVNDAFEAELITERLAGLMEYDAEMYLEDYAPPRKSHVFKEWKHLFLESLDEWGRGEAAVEAWLAIDPISPPDDPKAPLHDSGELQAYWAELNERIPGYIDELNEVYHWQALAEAPETVRVAFSL